MSHVPSLNVRHVEESRDLMAASYADRTAVRFEDVRVERFVKTRESDSLAVFVDAAAEHIENLARANADPVTFDLAGAIRRQAQRHLRRWPEQAA